MTLKSMCSILIAMLLITISTCMYSMQQTRRQHHKHEASCRRTPHHYHRTQYHKHGWQEEQGELILVLFQDYSSDEDSTSDGGITEEDAPTRAIRASLIIKHAKQHIRTTQQPAPITAEDKCPICLGELKEILHEARYRTACCNRFICKKCVENMWHSKQAEQKELQDSTQRLQYGRRQDFTGWPSPNKQVSCPLCRHSPLIARPLKLPDAPQAPTEQNLA